MSVQKLILTPEEMTIIANHFSNINTSQASVRWYHAEIFEIITRVYSSGVKIFKVGKRLFHIVDYVQDYAGDFESHQYFEVVINALPEGVTAKNALVIEVKQEARFTVGQRVFISKEWILENKDVWSPELFMSGAWLSSRLVTTKLKAGKEFWVENFECSIPESALSKAEDQSPLKVGLSKVYEELNVEQTEKLDQFMFENVF